MFAHVRPLPPVSCMSRARDGSKYVMRCGACDAMADAMLVDEFQKIACYFRPEGSKTTDRPQTTDHKPQTAGHRPQATDYRPQTTGHSATAQQSAPISMSKLEARADNLAR
ncbi:hypothetical protein K504DRAFT_458177 [Pleomassaria siparia CBS 279.74]|uniref:Uncharacterized protein n=1 Tax=Pleomassaria siparia CBS 279.74 TaxID=1314801 RepID=A0A6G1K496_9PLEO|nr:hypothetical protein K504DRAFT_458177 [Pleomassaria siparia CBS 279.74]